MSDPHRYEAKLMNVEFEQFPACPNLVRNPAVPTGGVCVRASALTGARINVTAAYCNVTCPARGGPHAGTAPADEEGWAGAAFQKCWARASAKKAVQKYTAVDVVVPSTIADVRTAFANVLSQPWCKGIGLTGSILYPSSTPRKDIDVVLAVDYAGFFAAAPALPTSVGGIKLDIHINPALVSVFMVLDITDPSNLTLNTSGLYSIKSTDPKIAKVVQTGMEKYAVVEPASTLNK